MFVVSDDAAGRCCPVPSVDHAVADSQLALKDSVVHYTCVEGFATVSWRSETRSSTTRALKVSLQSAGAQRLGRPLHVR